MKIQERGNEHVVGDRNCPGSESPEAQRRIRGDWKRRKQSRAEAETRRSLLTADQPSSIESSNES